MIFCYIFELKSIQNYIFGYGKLKDVIASSERLAALIDEPLSAHQPPSILQCVLDELSINSNLEDANKKLVPSDFYIVRANGGALQILTTNAQSLMDFRALWTLTVSQLFPGISFVDVIDKSDSASPLELINQAATKLYGIRNLTMPMYPRPTAAVKLCSRTAEAKVASSVRLPAYQDGLDISKLNNAFYISTTQMQLLNKFTPNESSPINFAVDEKELRLNEQNNDVALVHIDGNALGLILSEVRNALSEESDLATFTQKFRSFSQTIAKATILSAKDAVSKVVVNDGSNKVPIRPIVCGGDDVTVIIRANLALTFVQHFCARFEEHTRTLLSELNTKLFANKLQVEKLTASAGILFQKVSQPFSTAHHLAEELCKHAKDSYKSQTQNTQKVPLSMLSYFRISTVFNSDLKTLTSTAYTLPWREHSKMGVPASITLAATSFVIANTPDVRKEAKDLKHVYILKDVLAVIEKLQNKTLHRYFTLPKIRRLLTEISLGRFIEADDLIIRTLNKKNDTQTPELVAQFNHLYQQNSNNTDFWFTQDNENNAFSIVYDLVTLAKFLPQKDVSTSMELTNEI